MTEKRSSTGSNQSNDTIIIQRVKSMGSQPDDFVSNSEDDSEPKVYEIGRSASEGNGVENGRHSISIDTLQSTLARDDESVREEELVL